MIAIAIAIAIEMKRLPKSGPLILKTNALLWKACLTIKKNNVIFLGVVLRSCTEGQFNTSLVFCDEVDHF